MRREPGFLTPLFFRILEPDYKYINMETQNIHHDELLHEDIEVLISGDDIKKEDG